LSLTKHTDISHRYFDIRLEVHAPVNGSEAKGNPIPDPNFTFTIAHEKGAAVPAATYFNVSEPAIERWNFTWYEGKTKVFSFVNLEVISIMCRIRTIDLENWSFS
jgi:hypothetical protein